jgi:hypothetical protein
MILLTDEAVRLPRTLDLNPCDFLWGHLKQPIYSQPVNLVEELTGRVVAAGSKIREDREVFSRVRALFLIVTSQ